MDEPEGLAPHGRRRLLSRWQTQEARQVRATTSMRRKHRLGAPPFMPVKLQLDPRRLWSWHRAMVDHLRTVTGSNVYVEMAPPGASLPFAIGRVLSLERSVAGESHPAFIQLAVPDFAAPAGETADLHECVVDLAAEGLPPVAKPPMPQRPTILPLYDGAPGEAAMWAAILSGRAPRLDLYDTATGRILAIGQPAIEAPHSASASAAAVVVRLIEGIGHALAGRLEAADPAGGETGKSPTMAAAGLLARKIASKARRMKERMLADAPQWAVAWTCREEPAPRNRERLDPREYNLLADDGQRYYADPFLFAHEGEVFCFVEELPYATGRGLISVTTLSPDGRAATPWPVLETPCHLSYPQVFARDGEIYMLPEQHQSGALILYRAARFPSVWEPAGGSNRRAAARCDAFRARRSLVDCGDGPGSGLRGSDEKPCIGPHRLRMAPEIGLGIELGCPFPLFGRDADGPMDATSGQSRSDRRRRRTSGRPDVHDRGRTIPPRAGLSHGLRRGSQHRTDRSPR